MLDLNKIYQGDCLIESGNIESGSVDLILTDLPYGNMNKAPTGWNSEKLQWDIAIEPKKIYEIANRILRKNGKMVLFSQEPYSSKLINEAIPNIPFSYRAIWEKDNFANALGTNKNMVSFYEDILVFNKHFESENNDDNPCKNYAVKVFNYINKSMDYLKNYYGNSNLSHFNSNGKQFRLCTEETYNNLIMDFGISKMNGFKDYSEIQVINKNYKKGFLSTFNLWEGKRYKSNILKYKKDYEGLHPTQKPVLLLEDLIKTFSNENDLVVDLTAGSGSTLVACLQTNRNFIGIELEPKYVEIANKRIDNFSKQLVLV